MRRAAYVLAVALALAGCTVSPEYRAFVVASRNYFASTADVTTRALKTELNLPGCNSPKLPCLACDLLRDAKLGEVRDYEKALEANEQRVGLRPAAQDGK